MAGKLTKKQLAERETEIANHLAKLDAYMEWSKSIQNKVFDAEVRWFDRSSGVGNIYVPALDQCYTIYACNLPGKKTWFAETACVYYNEGQQIQVTLDARMSVTFIIGQTVAFIDNEKWNSLDQSKLAFKCDDEGHVITGLFA